jgi:toxin ParE1/3/4
MQLIWSRRATTDLRGIRKYIAEDNPSAARYVAERILSAAESLLEHPQKGRVGRLYNTRELVIHGWPYILVYTVRKDRVEILHVIHTSRNWP